MERFPVLTGEVLCHRMFRGLVTALHAASQQPMPPHLLIVRHQCMNEVPEIGWPRIPAQVFVKHYLAHAKKMRMFHQELTRQPALVTHRDGAIRARLQKQLRVADAAAREHDAPCGIKVQFRRDACSVSKAGQAADHAARRIGVEADYRGSDRNVNPRGNAERLSVLTSEARRTAYREWPVAKPDASGVSRSRMTGLRSTTGAARR